MIDRSLLEYVHDLSLRADGVLKVDDPRNVYLKRATGDVERVHVPPPIRSHELMSMDALLAILAVDETKAPEDRLTVAVDPEVHHGPGEVVAFLDRADRRDVARVSLPLSRPAAAMLSLEPGKSFDVRSLNRWLRAELGGAAPAGFSNSVRRVDFGKKSSSTTSVLHGGDTLGRSLEVGATTEIPEAFTVTCPLYARAGFDHHASFDVMVFVDAEAEQIALRLFPDERQLAFDGVHSRIQGDIAEKLGEGRVFYGRAQA